MEQDLNGGRVDGLSETLRSHLVHPNPLLKDLSLNRQLYIWENNDRGDHYH